MRNLASFLAKRMNLKGVASDSNGVSENIFHLKNLRSKALSISAVAAIGKQLSKAVHLDKYI